MRAIAKGRTVLALALALACGVLAPAGAAAAQESFVRVDQGGYPASAPKRAYVMAGAAAAGAPWWLEDEAGTHVASGTLGASAGRWSASFPDVYAVDFDGVKTPGRYRLGVGGAAPALSPQFAIAAGASLYTPLLQNARSFYENERDGPEFIPSSLRTAPAHLNDEHAMTYATPKTNGNGVFKGDLHALGETIDAAGGWWDAGDYLKFVETTSYTVSLMEAAVRDFPGALGGGAPADMTGEARFGVEWLLRMWDESTGTLYYQVGIGEGNAKIVGDHDIWRLPQADDEYGASNPADRYIRNRPVFRAEPPGAPDQPEPRGPRCRRVRPLLPAVPDERRSSRRPLSQRRRAHLRPRRHEAEGPAADGDPVRLLPRARMARRPRARRHRARRRARGRRRLRPSGGSAARAAVLLPRRRGALGWRIREEGARQL